MGTASDSVGGGAEILAFGAGGTRVVVKYTWCCGCLGVIHQGKEGSATESLLPWVVRYCQGDLVRAMAVNEVAPVAHHVAQCVVFCIVGRDSTAGV